MQVLLGHKRLPACAGRGLLRLSKLPYSCQELTRKQFPGAAQSLKPVLFTCTARRLRSPPATLAQPRAPSNRAGLQPPMLWVLVDRGRAPQGTAKSSLAPANLPGHLHR
eukprot:79849-Pelagomonas_calceolata.AAC.1